MSYALTRRRSPHPFKFASPDPYWRKPQAYKAALLALRADAQDNYVGGDAGPRPERGMLLDLLAAAALNIEDLDIPFETAPLFGVETAPIEGMFAIQACYPYAARHYANIVDDLRDYAIASLTVRNDVNEYAFGSLPALLASLSANLNTLTQFERRPPVNTRYEENRVAVEYTYEDLCRLRDAQGGRT